MRIGIPKETKLGESRVAVVPNHVRLLSKAGHRVLPKGGTGRLDFCKSPLQSRCCSGDAGQLGSGNNFVS